jgi:hypothetical protein
MKTNARFEQLYAKYSTDPRSLTWQEEEEILNLNKVLVNIKFLTEDEKHDISKGRCFDELKDEAVYLGGPFSRIVLGDSKKW